MITTATNTRPRFEMPAARPTLKLLHVIMADDEWGNRLMDEIARDLFATRPDAEEVEIQEHAGWFLRYARINGEIHTIGSANGSAIYPRIAAQWRQDHYYHIREQEVIRR